MEDSERIYDELIEFLDERVNGLAAQIREEVGRGKLIKGTLLPEDDRQERQERLSEHNLARIAKNELTVLPYTGDERLALLCETLLTLARTMTESRRALIELAGSRDEHPASDATVGLASIPQPLRISFSEPDGSQQEGFELSEELARTENALAQVASLLAPVREEVGTWP